MRAQKPSPRFSGKTEVLVFVIPATRARVVVLKDGSIVDDRSTAEFAGPAELSSFYERTLNDAL